MKKNFFYLIFLSLTVVFSVAYCETFNMMLNDHVRRIHKGNNELFLQRDRQQIEAIVGYVQNRMKYSNQNIDKRTVLWIKYLSRPHPAVSTIRQYLMDASQEFNVPVEILATIAQV